MERLSFLIGLVSLIILGPVLTLWALIRAFRARNVLDKPLLVGVSALIAIGSGALTLLSFVRMLGAASGEAVDPSQKARILGEASASSTSLSLFGGLWLLGIAMLFVFVPKGSRVPKTHV